MKKNIVLKTAMIAFAVVLIWTVVLCINKIVGYAGSWFANADKYTAGDAQIKETIKNLDIDWTSGKVLLAYHDENTVVISEKSKKPINEDKQMRWWMDGDTLRIRYEKEGFNLFSFGSHQDKELTVTLPEGTELHDVNISATSGTINVPSLKADTLNLEITSGAIDAAVSAETIVTDTTSGDIDLQVSGDTKSISAETTSGNIRIDAKNAQRFEAETTSGDILLNIAEVETLNVDATSGDVTIALPADAGFTADLDTTSGDIIYDLPLTKEGSKYTCGDGSGKVEVDTTSGDILLTVLAEDYVLLRWS